MYQNTFLSICLFLVVHGCQAQRSTKTQRWSKITEAGLSSTLQDQPIKKVKGQDTKSTMQKLAALLLKLHPSSAFGPSGSTLRYPNDHPGSTFSKPSRNAPPVAAETQMTQPDPLKLDPARKVKEIRGVKLDPALKELLGSAADAPRPGRIDKELFTNDPSCKVWEEFQADALPTPIENLQAAAAIAAKYMPKPFDRLGGALQAIEYWSKHAARTSYFVANALAGVAAFQFSGKGTAGDAESEIGVDSAVQLAASQILESVMVFEQDWQRIVKGNYAMPWDLTAGHRQNTLPYALRQSARVIQETMGIMERRTRAAPEDRSIWLKSSESIYPEYYKTNYHYQTDGWMSKRSADVYETSTEVIFFGRQDAQQRASLIPLQGLRGVNGRPLKILEVACGTGRFGTFLRDNHPTADVTYVDLSPFYLEKARENDDYWRNFRSSNNGGKPYAPASFVQAAAEALPFKGETFDVVVCVYLFHEMPEGPRAAAAAEMARVLAPGGTLVLSDSIQRGDRPALDDFLVGFENLNEPHYRNYISTPLADLFTPHGLQCGHRYVVCTSKTLSFTKDKKLQ